MIQETTLLVFLCAAFSFLLGFGVREFAKLTNAVDQPSSRKVHKKAVPRIGGVGIYISFMIFSVILMEQMDKSFMSIYIAQTLIVLIGLIDDYIDMKPKIKLAGQVLAAAIVVFGGGISIQAMNFPFGIIIDFGIFGPLMSIIWIIGITNAINLLDGLDGLAAGFSFIVLTTITFLAGIQGDGIVVGFCLVLAASVVGYLPHNMYPAKMFMGDTGSLFLGFSIASISLLGFKNAMFISTILPVFILSIPIFDVLFSIVRRKVNGIDFDVADKSHIHHKLLEKIGSHPKAVLFMHALAILYGIVSIIYAVNKTTGAVLIVLITAAVITLFYILDVIGIKGVFRNGEKKK